MRTLLGDRVGELTCERRQLEVHAYTDGAAFRDHFKSDYGPTISAYRAIAADADRVAALDAEIAALGDRFITGSTMPMGIPVDSGERALSRKSSWHHGCMPDDVQELPTLSATDQDAIQRWLQDERIGTTLTDVAPLTGGTQNIVVGMSVDGRRMVLRRPPLHPRPTSDKTMLREIAVLRTLAGSPVPHPGFIAACTDLDVIGVVFYLMEEVDGFNPGTEVSPEPTEADADLRYRVGLSYAGSLAELGNVAWENSELAAIRRPGSFLARQVPQFQGLLESYRHEKYSPESLTGVGELAQWLEDNRPLDAEPGIMHGDAHLNNVLLRRDTPELAAFIDWEMCTIGDPLLDLGWMLVCWPDEPNPDQRGIGAGRPRRAGPPR